MDDKSNSYDKIAAAVDEQIAADSGRKRARKAKSPNTDTRFTDTDIANAGRLVRHYGADLRFTEAGGWFVWDGSRWRQDIRGVRAQEFAKRTAEAIFDELKTASNRNELFGHAKKSQSRRAIEAMISLARSVPGVMIDVSDFDTDPMLLNVKNGTVDLRTGELVEHRRENLITKIAPVVFDPKATCDRWEAFLRQVTGNNEDLYNYLRRLVGYMLTGKTVEQALHFLYGPGANGKTVFCDIAADLLGDYAIILQPDVIMAKRHNNIPNDIARLRGARVTFMNETEQGSRFNESKLKDLTGGDKLTGRFLHQEFFDFAPTHKLVIRGNHKPGISGTDEGIWRRLRLVPFTFAIPPEQQDKRLLDKLRAELPGILRWAVEGCREWQHAGGLNPPEIMTEAASRYRLESDTLARFIDEHCIVDKLGQVKSGTFFQRYREFAEQSGERFIPSRDLPSEMQRRGFEWKRTKTGGMYFGLTLATKMSDPRCDQGDGW